MMKKFLFAVFAVLALGIGSFSFEGAGEVQSQVPQPNPDDFSLIVEEGHGWGDCTAYYIEGSNGHDVFVGCF
jgi:hypothetical protein